MPSQAARAARGDLVGEPRPKSLRQCDQTLVELNGLASKISSADIRNPPALDYGKAKLTYRARRQHWNRLRSPTLHFLGQWHTDLTKLEDGASRVGALIRISPGAGGPEPKHCGKWQVARRDNRHD